MNINQHERMMSNRKQRRQSASFVILMCLLCGVVQGQVQTVTPSRCRSWRRHAGRIVVDKTGLNGLFDFDLKCARDLAPSTVAIPAAQPELLPPLPGAPFHIAPGTWLEFKEVAQLL